MIQHHDDVREFLNRVCKQIKAKEVHSDIRIELTSHIEELTMTKEAEGAGREEAVQWALSQMGDPAAIGSELHAIHRPRLQWGILVGTLLFIALGVFALYSLMASGPGLHQDMMNDFLQKTPIVIVLGVILLGVFYFFDYRKLQRFAWTLYAITLAGMIYIGFINGTFINGSRKFFVTGAFSIDWFTISPYLLILASTGILIGWKKAGEIRSWLGAFFFIVLPLLFFYRTSAIPEFMLYLAGYLAVLGTITKKWLVSFVQVMGTLLVVITMSMVMKTTAVERFLAFLNPSAYANGAGYMNVQMKEAVSSGGWWGQGFGTLLQVPDTYSDGIYVYLIYCFGWAAGIAIALAAALFVNILISSAKRVNDEFGKTIMIGIAALIGFQAGYSILMSLGMVPILGISFPFVSYGGTHRLVELGAIGLILSIYRRKDLILAKNYS